MEKLTKTIEAVSVKRKEENQIGFMAEGLWYNVQGDVDYLNAILKEFVSKGNTVEFELELGFATNFKLVSEKSQEKEDSNDDMTNFEELLTAAHKEGITSIKTEKIEVDTEKKYALFKAEVTMKDGSVFEGHGDTTQDNIQGSFVKPHYIRMAETRAIVRALRWATNNAKCAEEETK